MISRRMNFAENNFPEKMNTQYYPNWRKTLNKRNYAIILSLLTMIASCNQNNTDNQTNAENNEAATSAPKIKRSEAPEDAVVYFITPRPNTVLSSPIKVEFGVTAMEIVPSGQNTPLTGHHHIIIDADLPDMNFPIPADENYIHFGDGSSETTLNLDKGDHTLQLIIGDYLHIPHNPPVYSDKITITVE